MPIRFNAYSQLISPNLKRATENRTAFIDDNGRYSFLELKNAVEEVSATLVESGIKENDRLLIVMLDRFTLPVTFLASIRVGIIPILLNTLLTQDDFGYILQDSDAKWLVTSPELLDTFEPLKTIEFLNI